MVNKEQKPQIGDKKTVNGVDYICKGFTSSGKPQWRKDDILKKAHNVGDLNKKGEIWTEYQPGKFDWRPKSWYEKKNKQIPAGAASAAASPSPAKTEEKKTTEQPKAKDGDFSAKKAADLAPDELMNYAKNASTEALSKVVNDTKADKQLRQLAFNELKTRSDYDKTKVNSADLAGGHVGKPTAKVEYKTKKPQVELPELEDFEAPDSHGVRQNQSISKLRQFYAKRTDDDLLKTLNNRKAKYQLRQIAYDEAAARGISEDKIDIRGTLEGWWRSVKDKKDIENNQNKEFNPDEAISLSYDWKGHDHKKILDDYFDGGADTSFLNPDSDIVKKVFKTETLAGRQLYDTFKDYYQRDPDIVPGYLNAQNKVNDLNGRMKNWAKADKAVMFVSAGGAGAGKTYGWQSIVAPYLSLKELDPVNGDPTATDWSWVMLGDKDCSTEEQLRKTLATYNGKWIDGNGHERPHILFFDDGDKMLISKSPEMANLLKRICDNNPKNRIFENPITHKKELWEGKILVTTNKDLGKLSANPDFAAVQSRIATSDIQFTRNETMELLADRYMDVKLGDPCLVAFEEDGFTDEEIEDFRQDVFDFMMENIQIADPRKFTPRTFLKLCDEIAPQWKHGNSAIKTGTGTMGTDIHWRKTALQFIKAQSNDIEKASVEEFYSKDGMLERKKELEQMMKEAKKDGSYDKLFGQKAQDAILFGKVGDEKGEKEEEEKKGKKSAKKKDEKKEEETKKGFDNEMSLDEAESILFG